MRTKEKFEWILLVYCSFCAGPLAGQLQTQETTSATDSISMDTPILPSTPSSVQPTSTYSQASVTQYPTSVPTAPGGPEPLMKYLIILGAATGFFLITTLLCSAVVMVMCCRKLRAGLKKREPKEGLFEGSQVSPHWINTPTPQETVEDIGTTDIPIWSVKTFESPSNQDKHKETNSTSSLNETPTNTSSSAPEPRADPTTRVPKRVAPPPPKGKKKKKAMVPPNASEHVEYAVPTTTSHGWFGRKKKAPSSKYKELNINQLQAPNTYATPNDS